VREPDFDRWITSGRYSQEYIIVTCNYCGEDTAVIATTDYGATEWEPGECKHCKEEFEGNESTALDEPPDPEPPDDFEEYYEPRN
jgi:hypothetical protein